MVVTKRKGGSLFKNRRDYTVATPNHWRNFGNDTLNRLWKESPIDDGRFVYYLVQEPDSQGELQYFCLRKEKKTIKLSRTRVVYEDNVFVREDYVAIYSPVVGWVKL